MKSMFFLFFCFVFSTVFPSISSLHITNTELLRYTYEAKAILNEADIHPDDKIYRMNADVDLPGLKVGIIFELSSRWTNPENIHDQIIEAQFIDFEVFNVSDRLKKDNSFFSKKRKSALRSLKKPVVFRWTDGLIKEFYVNSVETVTSMNIKRGILGLLQIQTESGQRLEEDASGLCPVSYTVTDNEVEKVKDIKKCVINEENFSALSDVVGVSSASTSRTIYSMGDDNKHIRFAASVETHVLRVNLKTDLSLSIIGKQNIGLLKTEKRSPHVGYSTKDAALKGFAKDQNGEKFIKESLLTDRDSKLCADGCLDIERVVSSQFEALTKENMANISSVEAYITAVRAARQADKKTLEEIFNDPSNKKIKLTLIDVLAATQTQPALEVLIESLDFSKTEKTSDIERALTGIAFSSHPSELTLVSLTKIFKKNIKSEKIRDTVALSLGAVLNKLCHSNVDSCTSHTAEEVKSIIRKGLDECGDDESLQTLYIQFVRNSGRPEFIPNLLQFAEKSIHPLVNHLAISSLGVYGPKDLGSKVLDSMNRIYHQNHQNYETTVRSAAANLILSSNPSEVDVRNIILSFPHQKSRELSMFLMERIYDLIKNKHPSSYVINKVVRDTSYSNYWTMAQTGMASAYTGNIYKSNDSYGSYGLFMEYSNAGMMRRTAVDFSLHGNSDQISLTQLGIVAQGLEGLTGSVPDEGEENLDSMVGMASTMMGVKLRPLTFFRGYSDMMSLIWGGDSGEGAGVEAMLMLMDFLQHISLASGLRVKTEVIGAISTKISADIKFSLWHRNVEIVTTNGGAISIQCRMSIESPMLRASVRNMIDAKSALEFSVFTDFKTLPPRSCMRLSHPDFTITKSLRKFERVRSSPRRMLAMRRENWDVRGRTLPLHQGNSLMCSLIVS